MNEKNHNNRYLTDEQVCKLNHRHGWLQYGDAQSDASRRFAHDAIDMYIRMRDSAPLMFDALVKIAAIPNAMDGGDWDEIEEARNIAHAAIAKAQGAA